MTAAGIDLSLPPPAARSWTVRRDEEVVVQVWRTIANAGPKGISKADLRDRLSGIDEQPLTAHLQELRKKGHARFDGVNGSCKIGVWVATATPWPNEAAPAWIEQVDEDSPPEGTADAVLAAARQVPASVFGLGLKIAGECDIDAAHSHQAAPAKAAQPSPPPKLQPKAPDAAEPGPIVVALDNHGRLLVHETGTDPVVLSRQATGALFGYLDRTCGGFLVDALP